MNEHPYSEVKRSGDLVFVSGSLSVDSTGRPVPGPREAIDTALAKLEARLALAGLSLDDVVSTTYYVTDISLRDQANEQFAQAFAADPPARTFVEVSRLPYGATVEISAIADASGNEGRRDPV